MQTNYNYCWQAFPNIYTPRVPGTDQGPTAAGHGQQQAASSMSRALSQQFWSNGRRSSVGQDTDKTCDFHLKVLNPANKKDYKMFTLRNVSVDEIESPEKLKKVIIDQCGESIAKQMDIGYFKQSKKIWLNNRLDMSDLLDLVRNKGENITLWCMETIDSSRKRNHSDTNDTEDTHMEKGAKKPKKLSKMEERKLEAEKYEHLLREKHNDKYTPFQYKLWAEMYVGKGHLSLDEPPSAGVISSSVKIPFYGK